MEYSLSHLQEAKVQAEQVQGTHLEESWHVEFEDPLEALHILRSQRKQLLDTLLGSDEQLREVDQEYAINLMIGEKSDVAVTWIRRRKALLNNPHVQQIMEDFAQKEEPIHRFIRTRKNLQSAPLHNETH